MQIVSQPVILIHSYGPYRERVDCNDAYPIGTSFSAGLCLDGISYAVTGSEKNRWCRLTYSVEEE